MAKINLIVLMILLVATFSHDVEGLDCPDGMAPYTLQVFDTCWHLSGGNHDKNNALRKANPGINCSGMEKGTVICAPPQSAPEKREPKLRCIDLGICRVGIEADTAKIDPALCPESVGYPYPSTGDDVEGLSCPVEMSPYQVKGGQTCWYLAGGTPEKNAALIRANPGIDCVGLIRGTVICAPPQPPPPQNKGE
ncbi:hypothetical protein LINGRAHAP2_LOCUS36527 [Linum grandiflorum]